MLRLKVTPEQGDVYRIPVDVLPLRIGRSRRSDLRLEDPFASRFHAELRSAEEGLSMRDLGSGNGTFLNGRRIREQVEVQAGDRIQIGGTLIELEVTGAGVAGTSRNGGLAPGEDLVAHPEATRTHGEDTDHFPMPTEALAGLRQAVDLTAGRREALEHRDALFSVISKVGAKLLSPASLDEVLHQILDLIFEGVAAERAFLLLREPPEGQLVCKLASYRESGGQTEREARISRTIIDEVVGRGRPVLTSDALADERFKRRESIIMARVRSVMAAPLAVEDRILGMLYVDSPVATSVFTDDDLSMLTTIAGVAAIKIENALLLEERLETERIRQQLLNAREIQSRLLPARPPEVAGFDILGVSLPCFEVGGDYFDYVEQPRGGLLLLVADVSGKGLDAALLMSSTHASIRTQVEAEGDLPDLVGRVNRFTCANSPENRFVTLFLAEVAPGRPNLRYINAGHDPPLLVRRDGGVEDLSTGGLPLGIVPAADYELGEVELDPGDVLLIYSDGVVDALNEEEEEFRPERLVEEVRGSPDASAAELHDVIDEALGRFMGAAPPVDDMTLVVVRRTGC